MSKVRRAGSSTTSCRPKSSSAPSRSRAECGRWIAGGTRRVEAALASDRRRHPLALQPGREVGLLLGGGAGIGGQLPPEDRLLAEADGQAGEQLATGDQERGGRGRGGGPHA